MVDVTSGHEKKYFTALAVGKEVEMVNCSGVLEGWNMSCRVSWDRVRLSQIEAARPREKTEVICSKCTTGTFHVSIRAMKHRTRTLQQDVTPSHQCGVVRSFR